MVLSPFMKTPLTDLTGAITSHQWGGQCADLELKSLDCLEAYGLDKGFQKCMDIMEDFRECALKIVEKKRTSAMRLERDRQYFMGERTKANRYAEAPKADSF